MFHVSNRNPGKRCEIYPELTIKTPDINDIILVYLLLTLKIFLIFKKGVSIVDFD